MNKNIITTIVLSVTFLICLCFLYPSTYRELIYILFSPIFNVLSIPTTDSHQYSYIVQDWNKSDTTKENFKKMFFSCLVFVSFIVTYSVLELILNENKPVWFQIFLYTISSFIFVLYLVQIIKYYRNPPKDSENQGNTSHKKRKQLMYGDNSPVPTRSNNFLFQGS